MSSNSHLNKHPRVLTELGYLPKDWRIVSFSTVVADTQLGTTRREANGKNRIPLIKMGNITWGSLDLDKLEHIDTSKLKSLSVLLLRENDLLFNTRNTPELVGKSAVWHNELDQAIYDNNINRIRLKSIALPDFVCYQITNGRGRQRLRRLAVGSTSVAAIYWKDLTKLLIYLPCVEEQKRIIDVLNAWDKAIALTEKRISAAEQRKKALMQQLLTGRVRFPEFVKSTEMQETRYGNLPADWQYVPIAQVARQESTKNKEDYEYPVLSCTKHRGLVDSLEYFGRQMYSKNLSTYKVVRERQFAYATNHIEEGSIGYQNLYDAALISPMYTVFETNEQVDDAFLYKLLKTEKYRHIFEVNTNGTVNRRGSLRWNQFSHIRIPLPSLEEQRRIAAVLNTCDRELALLTQKRDALQRQKKGLMQRLLTGRVRVAGVAEAKATG